VRHIHDVIITGAGSAGYAAARTLANADFSVGLFDKAVFPRDKTCGDTLIPAHHVLKKLGLMEHVTSISCPAKGMRLIGFDGSNVLIRADSACGRRLKLDALLLGGATETGILAAEAIMGQYHPGRTAVAQTYTRSIKAL
jgi:2-polyprenyl-6-methoxyphenol hydroxylase-like FAD-dependent oxidoreductase